MDLRKLRYFVAVADELHFGRAAARLHVVQAAVSQQIRLLEQEIGVGLFQRSTRAVALTEPGRAFLIEAREAIKHADRARSAAREIADGASGHLAIGFVDNAVWSVLPRMIRAFRHRYPRVELTLSQMTRTEQVAKLESGELDFGILPAPLMAERLVGRQLIAGALEVALPENHRLAAKEVVEFRDLKGEPLIAFPSAVDARRIDEILHARCAEAGFVPTFAQPVQQMHTALALVSGGLGLVLVPNWLRRAWAEGVAFRPLVPHAPYVLMLVMPDGTALRPAAISFRDTMTVLIDQGDLDEECSSRPVMNER